MRGASDTERGAPGVRGRRAGALHGGHDRGARDQVVHRRELAQAAQAAQDHDMLGCMCQHHYKCRRRISSRSTNSSAIDCSWANPRTSSPLRPSNTRRAMTNTALARPNFAMTHHSHTVDHFELTFFLLIINYDIEVKNKIHSFLTYRCFFIFLPFLTSSS